MEDHDGKEKKEVELHTRSIKISDYFNFCTGAATRLGGGVGGGSNEGNAAQHSVRFPNPLFEVILQKCKKVYRRFGSEISCTAVSQTKCKPPESAKSSEHSRVQTMQRPLQGAFHSLRVRSMEKPSSPGLPDCTEKVAG